MNDLVKPQWLNLPLLQIGVGLSCTCVATRTARCSSSALGVRVDGHRRHQGHAVAEAAVLGLRRPQLDADTDSGAPADLLDLEGGDERHVG